MNILCGCGELARCRTSWTENNPARRFLGCPNFMDPTTNCNFFQWVDAPLPNRWYQARMYELYLNRRNAQEQLLELNNRNSRILFYNRLLIVLLVGMVLIKFL
ncbi:hypothetical protein CTI12_AA054730 [Artemisia annua]|uniref:GRF-type domain-containing protein n=1 Tax=Artemisia annua TaxID=35608 RepID=A0A2U1QAJ1_ARTAN|nr:hypothetical protein CTI12_AA054730 [Artemisia annua]